MKKLPFILLLLTILLNNCSPVKYVNNKQIVKIFPRNGIDWSLEECNQIIDFYSTNISPNQLFNSKPNNQKVFIKTLLLNKNSIQAMSKKEIIEKRLNKEDYYKILDSYLREFTSLTYSKSREQIIEADSNFSKGYSFKIYFENTSDPFEPIFLEDGYSYFFLENMNGEFSRVTEVTGLFVEDYFQLDGYLDVIVTFSPFSTIGRRLFEEKNLNESYRLVFNGLQKEPIIVQWILQ